MSKLDLHDFEERLLDQQEQLMGVTELIKDSSKTVTLDQNSVGRLSRMDAMQAQALAQAGGARQQQQLSLIAEALDRIDTGEFGRCLECDKEIASARLNIDPTVRHCIVCANHLEK